jgi:hypothetical protein
MLAVEGRVLLADLAQHGATFGAGEPVDVELAVKVASFVLQAAG